VPLGHAPALTSGTCCQDSCHERLESIQLTQAAHELVQRNSPARDAVSGRR
jgi:hypothetical protein